MKHIKLFEQFVNENRILDIDINKAAGHGLSIGKYDDAKIDKTTPYWAEGFDHVVSAMNTFPDKNGNIVSDENAYSEEILEYAAKVGADIAGVKLKFKNGGLYSNKVKGVEMSFEFEGGKWVGTRKEGALQRGGAMDIYQFIQQFVALSIKLQKR